MSGRVWILSVDLDAGLVHEAVYPPLASGATSWVRPVRPRSPRAMLRADRAARPRNVFVVPTTFDLGKLEEIAGAVWSERSEGDGR